MTPKEAKHTPGPLFCGAEGFDFMRQINIKWNRKDAKGRDIYEYRDYDSSLIAAAPELLEFAKLVMKWADTSDVNNNTQRVQSVMGLRAAIQKAEGQGR